MNDRMKRFKELVEGKEAVELLDTARKIKSRAYHAMENEEPLIVCAFIDMLKIILAAINKSIQQTRTTVKPIKKPAEIKTKIEDIVKDLLGYCRRYRQS